MVVVLVVEEEVLVLEEVVSVLIRQVVLCLYNIYSSMLAIVLNGTRLL